MGLDQEEWMDPSDKLTNCLEHYENAVSLLCWFVNFKKAHVLVSCREFFHEFLHVIFIIGVDDQIDSFAKSFLPVALVLKLVDICLIADLTTNCLLSKQTANLSVFFQIDPLRFQRSRKE